MRKPKPYYRGDLFALLACFSHAVNVENLFETRITGSNHRNRKDPMTATLLHEHRNLASRLDYSVINLRKLRIHTESLFPPDRHQAAVHLISATRRTGRTIDVLIKLNNSRISALTTEKTAT